MWQKNSKYNCFPPHTVLTTVFNTPGCIASKIDDEFCPYTSEREGEINQTTIKSEIWARDVVWIYPDSVIAFTGGSNMSSLVFFPQWQFWQLGWQGWLLTRHLHPPVMSPLPCKKEKKEMRTMSQTHNRETFLNMFIYLNAYIFTFGPHRACLVTQQISVLHIKQQIQSHPSFFWTMMSHRGHFMASPFCSRLCSWIQWNSVK